ncbi:VOC family protein [Brachybacterium sp. MASK1Z-5]|uniref:VOC family protein n=1 Tax=Brachybacterium halotolerans TaxID=2795215 RepID=A0ABS1B9V5_9MICO|nr:VOC family protein [Brachybacterium halotolerans]MBK0331438.1 VOC family protein [Brachybacterium halotolerans]
MRRMLPFLTLQPARGQHAAEAIALYTSLFDEGRVVSHQAWPEGAPGLEALDDPAEAVQLAEIEIVAGQRLRLSDTLIRHGWDMTPGVSLWIDCADAAEQERVFGALVEGGMALMPLDDYGFGPFGWVQDRFGVTWQLAVAADDPQDPAL